MKISSKNRGKSGGARIITHIQVTESRLFLLSIYDKAEKESISENEIKDLLKFIE